MKETTNNPRKKEIRRIFYPIGQGAFYAEKHPNFTIVYDCGNLKNTKDGDNVVKCAFTKDEEIDLLFISHLDWDHISKIGVLKSRVKSIKRVVLPLLTKEEENLLVNIHRAAGKGGIQLIQDPKGYFGEQTEIIRVRPHNGSENEEVKTIEFSNENEIQINDRKIDSGAHLIMRYLNYDWVFIPYNLEQKKRGQKLAELLSHSIFDVEKLKNDPQYTLNILTTTKDKNKLKKLYESVDGDINSNSLMLYSGPLAPSSAKKMCYHRLDYYTIVGYPYYPRIVDCIISFKPGCIYTGDGDLNQSNIIDSIFSKVIDNVGTIQIPHHGSSHNFNVEQIRSRTACPISVGKNTFGHPNMDVIADLQSNDCYPIIVDENPNHTFIEHIMIDEIKPYSE